VFILLSRGHFFRTRATMIALTRLNGQKFVINAEKIRYLEQTPDTMVCCESGEKLMVKESLDEVIRRAIDYARAIRKPITE
jgi:flagellar protein FlbD